MSVLGPLVAFVIAWRLSILFARPTSVFYLADEPNDRSLHTVQTSRAGGIALLTGLLAGLGLRVAHNVDVWSFWPPMLGAVAVASVSLLDDRRGVSPLARLVVHLVAAGCAIAGGVYVTELRFADGDLSLPVWVGAMSSGLLLVWFINLYNFMDGMDGFAGGMTLIGFGALAALGAAQEAWTFSLLAATVAAAAGGFLVVNWPPARIFLGDTGASVLGMLACVMCLWGDREGYFSLWVGLLVFSPFFADATFTLVRRALRGEAVWRAHHSHCYQRLVRAGWSHRKTSLSAYTVMLGAGVSAIVAQQAELSGRFLLVWFLAGGWLLAYTVMIALVHRVEASAKR